MDDRMRDRRMDGDGDGHRESVCALPMMDLENRPVPESARPTCP